MLHKLKDFIKTNLFLCITVATTFLAILITGIVFGQEFWRMLPLFISLVVMLLQAKVNRYAYLLGGLNSVLYAIAYFSMGIRESALSALLMSFPLQVITFILWQRKTKGNVTALRKLNGWAIAGITISFALVWAAMFFWFPHDETAGTFTIVMDTTTTLLGFITTILTLLRFREYIVTQIITTPLSLAMHVMIMVNGNTANITYVIFTVYTIICLGMALVRIAKQKTGN
ncbi:MAG: nicotinamide mononucleotide transporter [Clostridia bacterium]|nr:nicotinamide mononucleotide transporter [Clostridia bacterium]